MKGDAESAARNSNSMLGGRTPTLDDLATDPVKATTLTAEMARVLTLRCAVVLTALAGVAVGDGRATGEAPHEDRLLSVGEAAQALRVSRDWIYRRAGRLPFTVRLGRQLRFSAAGIARYIRQREGR